MDYIRYKVYKVTILYEQKSRSRAKYQNCVIFICSCVKHSAIGYPANSSIYNTNGLISTVNFGIYDDFTENYNRSTGSVLK